VKVPQFNMAVIGSGWERTQHYS